MTTRVAIIGSGSIATYRHAPEYAALPDVEILAFVDRVPERAEKLAKKYDAKALDDYKAALEMKGIDAVSVCTPNYLHKQPTIDALEAGKHVLVEKPLAMDAVEGKAMVDAERRARKKLQVGFMTRFQSSAQALKRFVEAGEMGDIYFARAQAMRQGPAR